MTGTRNSGRKRKPAAIRRAEGNRSRRPIPNEPEGRGQPHLPPHLTAGEKVIWARVLETVPAGVLSACDEFLLEAFAISVATFREADALVKRSSLMVRGSEGSPIPNPLLRVRSRALSEFRACAIELGLSPAARTRLVQEPSPEDDPMAMLLGTDEDPALAWSTLPKH